MSIFKKEIRINHRIRAKEVRVIDDNGNQLGVMSAPEAIKKAEEAGLDLVEIAPTATPPVCRIMDNSRYKYEQEKKEKEARRKQKVIHLKEIRMGPKIGEHDYQFKLRHLTEFLKKGDKVKVTMIFKGREMAHIDLGRKILDRLSSDISTLGEIEEMPKLEGRFLNMVIRTK
ncbi:MAG: translation initiation factor IF-3 [Omnitrophica bacterium RIFCSPLOWO2_02_FULL_45_16]|nr:MAG: translation initiation factor IF-3 [Omnitrophica bacterium RIFCSPHIGHO2_02_FULL_46_20]OGW94315.1 MAG: translation initiation factor IF-3 [Omnitrophica bacterium RIFCSPLOWO2_12_FULL_45_13]OGW95309.1 MAG: translation initiation factor IF-3 [Omnitrophica bacterium RIFCSPLOWO2_01_FULL_45_24]OGW99873.1 MAG: translation initiation factor IF-3 [Omnitrophica bacterium RIFCSPLOWO2_02_FULL_45_16]